MKLHTLLARQLLKLKLNEDELPSDAESWRALIEKVNKCYLEADQERYLLERSMDISSKEMRELNSKLESAQQIARLGYWSYDREHEQIIWSKELYSLLNLEFYEAVPGLFNLYDRIHPDDIDLIKNSIEKAFSEAKEYEAEIRMQPFSQTAYQWFYVVGRPVIVKDKPITQLNGIMLDIQKRKETEEEVKRLHQQLLESARRAGMADVATSILHNVGNILNSANVSLSLMLENIKAPYFKRLFSINELLQTHAKDLAEFLTNDEKGKYVVSYLFELNAKIENIHESLIKETLNVKRHMDHIKDITNMQQSLSGKSGVFEKVNVVEAIDTSIEMCGGSFKRHRIEIIKNYALKPIILTDSSKLLQILVNILQNAKDALLTTSDPRKITIDIHLLEENLNCIEVIIADNGIGIMPENITNIFSFGFTTKATGHGFGLHSSSLTAKELGGNLKATSEGLHKGASFILTLPLTGPARRVENESITQSTHSSN